MNRLLTRIKTLIQAPKTKQEAVGSWSHWSLFILFGLLCIVPFWGKGLILLALLGLVALINGPMLFVFGMIYTALFSLFPPLALLFSLILLIRETFFFVRNWRFGLLASYFYGMPVLFTLLLTHSPYPIIVTKLILLCLSLLILYALSALVYTRSFNSHGLLWNVISIPYDVLLFLIPKRFSKRFSRQTHLSPARKHFK